MPEREILLEANHKLWHGLRRAIVLLELAEAALDPPLAVDIRTFLDGIKKGCVNHGNPGMDQPGLRPPATG